MHLNSLLEKIDLIENSDRRSIFESIGQGDSYFSTWEREIHPVLCEVALDRSKIEKLFKSIEVDAGRSGLGKASDALKGAKDTISTAWFDKFGGMLQKSKPVKAFDQKWEDLKSSIADKHPELAAKLSKYGKFAENNPKLHKFLLAVGGSVAAALGIAAAGGIGAGALTVGAGAGVATGILNIADRLLQGQKASTAIGRGATTGAIAGVSAALAAKVADMIKAGFQAETAEIVRGNKIMKGTYEYNGRWTFATGRPEDIKSMSNAFRKEDWNAFYEILKKTSDPEYIRSLNASRELTQQAISNYQETAAVIKDIAKVATATAAGGASAATNQKPKENLSEGQINELFGITGNKVDANKLEKAWKKAGSPTDSNELSVFLSKQGVPNLLINKSFTKLGIELPKEKNINDEVDLNDLLNQILKLDQKLQREILDLLTA